MRRLLIRPRFRRRPASRRRRRVPLQVTTKSAMLRRSQKNPRPLRLSLNKAKRSRYRCGRELFLVIPRNGRNPYRCRSTTPTCPSIATSSSSLKAR
ncbi:unnamed protein product [Nippostrongylus brasiliensis]|uniref:Coat protein n=1 Tax=Nippostrongylus brasiliensis TaxID=27835 RepID=A0A0N4XNR3_NIPBR|nr:unnamed protein product [Nippostrongylus brasiliensis]